MPEPQRIATIAWLFSSGGIAPLALGLTLALIGFVFVIRPNRTASMILAATSLLPAILGMILVYTAADQYADLAAAPTPPKPTQFAETTGRAMSSSFCSLLGTIIPQGVALLALSRAGKNARNSLDTATH